MLVFLFLRGNVSLGSLPFSSPLSDLVQRTHSCELRILVAFRISPVAYLKMWASVLFFGVLGGVLNVDLKCELECLLLSVVCKKRLFNLGQRPLLKMNTSQLIVKLMYKIFAIN